MKRLIEFPSTPVVIVLTLMGLLASGVIWMQFQPHEYLMKYHGGYGIVDYELAWNAYQAERIIGRWGTYGVEAARRSLWLDFAFMPSYALMLGGVTLLLARRFDRRWQYIGVWLVMAPFAAALFDLMENIWLLRMLEIRRDIPASLPLMASIAASIKFGLLATVVLYALGCLVIWLLRELGITGVRVE